MDSLETLVNIFFKYYINFLNFNTSIIIINLFKKLAPHRDALRSLCETEMKCRYRQRMNRAVPVVLRRRNLILVSIYKYFTNII